MTDLTARKKMLDTLSDDLVYEGWDLPCKLWMVLGEVTDPYLGFVGNYEMEPVHWFMHRAEEGAVTDNVIGLVTCWESWRYPSDLHKHLEEHSGSPAVAAYHAIIAPDEHPDRGNLRTIMSVYRDGAILKIEHGDDNNKIFGLMENVPPTGPVGEALVDCMRSMLGINALPMHKLLNANVDIESLIAQAKVEGWSPERLGAEIFKRAECSRARSRPMPGSTMPDGVRKYLDEMD